MFFDLSPRIAQWQGGDLNDGRRTPLPGCLQHWVVLGLSAAEALTDHNRTQVRGEYSGLGGLAFSGAQMIYDADQKLSHFQTEDISIIEQSGLFDAEYYLRCNSDVAKEKTHPLVHFVLYGADEGRDPNKVFITKRYAREQAASIPRGRNAFAHFLVHGSDDDLFDRGLLSVFRAPTLRRGIAALKRLPIYSEQKYLEMNSDVSSATRPLDEHAFLYGFPEGRSVLNKLVVAESLGRLACVDPSDADPTWRDEGRAISGDSAAAVYYNTLGNGFIKEIAGDLVTSLIAAGFDAVLLDETTDPGARPPISIIIAPHEFFHLGRGRQWATDEVVSQSFMFNTEQLQTIWFERGLPFMLMSRGVIDICCQVAGMFAEGGVKSLHYNPEVERRGHNASLGWLLPGDDDHPMLRILPREARTTPSATTRFEERPIDVAFFGGSSPHREGFFARHAQFLAELECFLYYRRFDGPQKSSKRDGILSRLAGHVSAHSKLTLNIHRDDYGFFEWHRIVKLAMAGGSVVVSEPCLAHPLFKPDVHFFEESARHMPDLIGWLLHTDDGRARAEEVRLNALSVVQDATVIARGHRCLQSFLADAS